jgi:mono/diheme cytochrome c family protein
MRLLSAVAVLGSLSLLPCSLSGKELGDPGAGFSVAEEVCAECHAILPGQGFFPEPDPLPFEDSVPLPFEDIANTLGITELALFAWMTSSHPTMPDIILEADELRDVVAYILNLKN